MLFVLILNILLTFATFIKTLILVPVEITGGGESDSIPEAAELTQDGFVRCFLFFSAKNELINHLKLKYWSLEQSLIDF